MANFDWSDEGIANEAAPLRKLKKQNPTNKPKPESSQEKAEPVAYTVENTPDVIVESRELPSVQEARQTLKSLRERGLPTREAEENLWEAENEEARESQNAREIEKASAPTTPTRPEETPEMRWLRLRHFQPGLTKPVGKK